MEGFLVGVSGLNAAPFVVKEFRLEPGIARTLPLRGMEKIVWGMHWRRELVSKLFVHLLKVGKRRISLTHCLSG